MRYAILSLVPRGVLVTCGVLLALVIAASGCTIPGLPTLTGQFAVPASCGNGACDFYDNVQNIISEENFVNCPSECPIPDDPNDVTTKAIRPLVSGLRYTGTSGCSLGYITHQFGKAYIITAAHCVPGVSHIGMPPVLTITPDSIGVPFEQAHHYIGSVARVPREYWVDIVLIEIAEGVEAAQMTSTGHKYSGYEMNPYIGQRVMKVGTSTGLTYGKIYDITETYYLENNTIKRHYDIISIASDSPATGEVFAQAGDSGSAILTADSPHRLVGILAAGYSSYTVAIPASEIIPQLDLWLAT